MTFATQSLLVLKDEIRQAQERLQQAGMNPGLPDGIAGQQTTTAIQQFQRVRGLPVTGWLDEATRQALGLQPAAPAPGSQAAAESLPHFVYQPKPEYPYRPGSRGGRAP